jgi:hypothetical protein
MLREGHLTCGTHYMLKISITAEYSSLGTAEQCRLLQWIDLQTFDISEL